MAETEHLDGAPGAASERRRASSEVRASTRQCFQAINRHDPEGAVAIWAGAREQIRALTGNVCVQRERAAAS
jgi:hypothetical protein